MEIDVLLLAGGENRRMQGRFKGSLALTEDGDSGSFLERLIEELTPHAHAIRISGPDALRERFPGIPVVADIYPGAGPASGLQAGLAASDTDWTAAAACDMPCLTWELFDFLRSQADLENADAVFPTLQGRCHPLAGLYHRRLSPVLEDAIRRGDRKILAALHGRQICCIPVDEQPLLIPMLMNINTPEEYRRYLKECSCRCFQTEEKGDE